MSASSKSVKTKEKSSFLNFISDERKKTRPKKIHFLNLFVIIDSIVHPTPRKYDFSPKITISLFLFPTVKGKNSFSGHNNVRAPERV